MSCLFSSRQRTDSQKRAVKKCAFDIESLLKPTNNSSYADDTEDNSSDDGHIFLNRTSSPNMSYSMIEQPKTKCKRMRTIFTNEQLERLEVEFEKQQYMVGNERLYLAKQLQLSEAQVKVSNFLSLSKQIHLRVRSGFKIVV